MEDNIQRIVAVANAEYARITEYTQRVEKDLIEHRELVVKREQLYIETEKRLTTSESNAATQKTICDKMEEKIQEDESTITRLRADREQLIKNQEDNSARRRAAEATQTSLQAQLATASE